MPARGEDGYVTYLREQLAAMGDITAKRLFGGYALGRGGVTFGLVFEESLYLKVDETTRAEYEAHGSHPFTYEKNGKTIIIRNWLVPSDILEDAEQLVVWAEKAWNAAAAQAQKAPKPRRK